MNPTTGALATFETVEDARSAGFTVKLKELEAQRLLNVKRDERAKALDQMRSKTTKKKKKRRSQNKRRRR